MKCDRVKRKIALLGNPNVGKSVIFGLLTGKYVSVSNYPGTTVEVTKGISSFDRNTLIIDTPGINSLIPTSEDERVARDIILTESLENVILVCDTKNLRRALFLSLQLAEARVPFVLNLNMYDEARSRGISIDKERLSNILGVDVCPTIAIQRKGIRAVLKSISQKRISTFEIKYEEKIENVLEKIIPLLPELNISKRSIALMLLCGDENLEKFLSGLISEENVKEIKKECQALSRQYSLPLGYVINQIRMKKVDEILTEVMTQELVKGKRFSIILGNLFMHPISGSIIAVMILYLVYKVVGVFGAGTCVDFLEEKIFNRYINPIAIKIVESVIPLKIIQDALVGEYGIITMGLTYSIAIIFPIVGIFFIIFGILEDSGYLPRLAFMVNRGFKLIGLNGKAILPMILGLGCGTMAILSSRILATKRERILITLLLALCIPCSTQLGIIFGEMAAISGGAVLIWLGTIIFVLLVVGSIASVVIPGKSSDFIIEVPPIRVPQISNILIKTVSRLEWYLKEAVPLFILGTFLLFLLYKTGILNIIEMIFSPVVVNILNLPKETAGAFILGFLRRDYATVLITRGENLSGLQMLVAVVTITLFVPCIAQFFIMIKERGLKTTVWAVCFIFIFAFLFGGLFNLILRFIAYPSL